MDSAGGRCVLEFSGSDTATPSPGEAVEIELDVGEGLNGVFSGQVDEVSQSAASMRVIATDDLTKLARLDVEVCYEEVSVDFIVRDLLDRAGAKPGTIEQGPTFPAFALHRGPRAYRYLQHLAELCGVELYSDGAGAVHFSAPRTGPPDHRFRYGKDVRAFSLTAAPSVYDGVVEWGEGAASRHGPERSHWLAKDLSSTNGTAAISPIGAVIPGKKGEHSLVASDGAIRSLEDAQALAEARAKAIASRPIRGYLEVLGAPAVQIGYLVAIEGLPSAQFGHLTVSRLSQSLRVRRLRHTLRQETGYITRFEF